MLYLFFRGIMIFLSVMGFVSMAATEDYKYIIFPICVFIWALYTFFNEEDKEYRRRHGTTSGMSWFDDDYGYYGDEGYYGRTPHTSYRSSYNNSSSYTPQRTCSNPAYKKIVKRCKKSVNITIEKLNKNKEENKNG